MPKNLKKISEEIIHENPWWSYKHDRYELPSGSEGDYYYGYSRGMSMIVPVLPDGRIILTIQFRYLQQKQSIEFPSGGIEEGSNALETAKKELLEETGCIANELIKIGEFQSTAGMFVDGCSIFIAKVTECGQQKLDESEEIDVIYRHPHEVDEMTKRNDIWDGQSLAAWALAHQYFVHRDEEDEED